MSVDGDDNWNTVQRPVKPQRAAGGAGVHKGHAPKAVSSQGLVSVVVDEPGLADYQVRGCMGGGCMGAAWESGRPTIQYGLQAVCMGGNVHGDCMRLMHGN